jgi:transcriptional regulator with XRE-family HTH domain
VNPGLSGILFLLRTERGYSQRKVAGDLGVSQALLSHYENGIREPKLELLVRMCGYYDVSADYLLGRTDERRSVVLPGDTEERRRAGAQVKRILDALDGIGDGPLSDIVARYFTTAASNLAEILEHPEAVYDAARDADIKTAEAEVRRRRAKCAKPERSQK